MRTSNKLSKHCLGGFFVIMLVFAFSSTSAQAQVLFDNGPADLGTINQGGAGGYFADPSTGTSQVGDVFTPTQGGTARSINFAGLYADYSGTTPLTQTTDSFTIYLYSVVPGVVDAPGSLISQSTLSSVTSSIFAISGPTGIDSGVYVNFPMYQFSGNLTTPFDLSTGTDYFLAISDVTSPARYFSVDVTTTPGSATDGWELDSPLGTFPEPNASLAFSLSSNTVPEPATYALLAVGLSLLAFFRFRARRV